MKAETTSDPEAASSRIPTVLPAPSPVRRWWLDLPVRFKLLTIVALVAAVSLPSIAACLAVNARLIDARDEAREATEKADQLDELQNSLRNTASIMHDYMLLAFRESGLVTEYDDAVASIDDQIATVRQDLPDELESEEEELEAAVDDMVTSLDGVVDIGATTVRELGPQTGPVVFDVRPPRSRRLLAVIQAALETPETADDAVIELENQFAERLDAARRRVDHYQTLLVQSVFVSIAVTVVAAAGVTFVVTNGVVGRIKRVSQNAQRFLRDEPLLPAVASGDEVGQLSDKLLFAGQLLESRRMEAETATKAKDDFLSRVSHELKTPLTAMIGFAQLLEEDPDLTPEGRDDAANIVREGEHLHEMIEEMLDIKALEAGKLAVSIEPLAVGSVIDEAVDHIRAEAANRRLSLDVDCPADLTVPTDRRSLRDALQGLLSNAVTSSSEGGHVEVAAGRRDDTLRVRVTDAGRGLSPDEQERIFQPFEQLDLTDAEAAGRSVRLSRVRYVVEALGGTVGVDSPPGEGSTVWFELPLPPGERT